MDIFVAPSGMSVRPLSQNTYKNKDEVAYIPLAKDQGVLRLIYNFKGTVLSEAVTEYLLTIFCI